jgi:hypothetical protein
MKNLEYNIQDLDPRIVAVPSNKTMPIIIAVIGLALFLVGMLGVIAHSIVNTLLMIVGFAVLIYGGVKAARAFTNPCSGYIYQPTGGKLKKHTVFIQPENLQKVNTIFTDGHFNALKNVKKEMNAKGMLEIMATDDTAMVMAQIFEYIPYNYEPVSDVFIFMDGKGKELLEFCQN